MHIHLSHVDTNVYSCGYRDDARRPIEIHIKYNIHNI